MKKGLRWFLIFAVVITALLYFLSSNYEVDTNANGEKTLIKIDNTTERDLTAWLGLYQSGSFERVKVINDTMLEGYIPTDKQDTAPIMSIQSNVKVVYYNLIQTQKPATTTLQELGISLTGDTLITASTQEENVWSKLFLETILPLIFFLVAALFLLRFLGPK